MIWKSKKLDEDFGYVPANVQISRYVPAYDRFAKIRKYINSINSSHIEAVTVLHLN
ncbi:hypothetical protein K6R36_002266 [Listeria monocytogenes]|uniref:hypothetical protein n=1 Tax=Listeria monocytogenes TaxID=1639 RepID=UPI00290596D0|nr:hypothetical protein [Listeria monocytogenes]EHZ8191436.1 hypothetical protein [Listeria monocytogenes]